MSDVETSRGLSRIARPGGGLAMVAIDQRESLRTMIQRTTADPVGDEAVVQFKVAIADILAPYASGMLFDADFGYPALDAARLRNPACGLIVSTDKLVQERGGPVTDTYFDTELDLGTLRSRGVVALKCLILWRGTENDDRCVEQAASFMATCRREGLLGIVEAMVQMPSELNTATWDRNEAIVDAARALASSQPDLYKADVPTAGLGPDGEITAWSERVTAVIGGPWVVLSAGVAIEDFPRGVGAACRGGASGFLAGRAVWADAIGESYRTDLETTAGPRLRRLVEIVDSEARPWTQAISVSA